MTAPRPALPWTQDDGGRARAGFKGSTGDCVVRAVAIATGQPYRDVYDALQRRQAHFIATGRTKTARTMRAKSATSQSVRNGVLPEALKPYLTELGWVWTATMHIGSGTTVHLAVGELPTDRHARLIVRLSGHMSAVIDGVVHDTYDPCREGTRAVYGSWHLPT